MPRISDPVDVKTGARIKIRRRLLGVSQDELAQAIGISFQQVQKYERGINRVSASMLVRIAKRLETSVAALVGDDGSEPLATEVLQQLASPGAIELLDGFCALPNNETRQAILRLIAALSGRPEGQAAAA